MWCSIARTARWSTSSVAAGALGVQRLVEAAAEDGPQHLERLGRQRRAAPVGPAEHATLVQVEGHEVVLGVAETQASRRGSNPSRASTFQRNAADTSGLSAGRQGPERAEQHAVELGVRLAVHRHLVDRLEHGDRPAEPVEVVAEP